MNGLAKFHRIEAGRGNRCCLQICQICQFYFRQLDKAWTSSSRNDFALRVWAIQVGGHSRESEQMICKKNCSTDSSYFQSSKMKYIKLKEEYVSFVRFLSYNGHWLKKQIWL